MSVDRSKYCVRNRVSLFSAAVRCEADRFVICLSGELDLAADADMRALFDRAAARGPAVTAVDLSGVTFIDAHAIGLIAASYRSATERGRVFGVVGLHGVVAELFRMLHLEQLVLAAVEPDDRKGEVGGRGSWTAVADVG